jgi:uncharacterized membrane protein
MTGHPRATLILYLWPLAIPVAYLTLPLKAGRLSWSYGLLVAGAFAAALGVAALTGRAGAPLTRLERLIRPSILLPIICLLYLAGSLAVFARNYASFSPYLSQLGLFSQSMWTTLHGHALANTHETVDGSLGSHFGVHFSPTLLLLVPLYGIWSTPWTLMVLQAAAVALIPVPLYALLRRYPGAGPAPATVLAGSVLLLPALLRAGHFDFHDTAFLPVLLLTCLWALESRRPWIFLPAAIAALGVREDVAFTLVALGVYAVIRGHGWKVGLAVAGLGAAWFVATVSLVMPAFWSPGLWMDPGRFFVLHMGRWGSNPLEAMAAIASRPAAFAAEMMGRDRLFFLYQLFVPTLFLPVLGSFGWIPGVPALAAPLLSEHGWLRQPFKYHALLPLLFAYFSVCLAAIKVARRLPAVPSAGLATALIVLAGILPSLYFRQGALERRPPPADSARAVLSALPGDVPVYVPLGLYPHVANRVNVGCRESMGDVAWTADVRGAYRWVVLWTGEDDARVNRDVALADSLRSDPRFVSVPGFEPLTVFRQD